MYREVGVLINYVEDACAHTHTYFYRYNKPSSCLVCLRGGSNLSNIGFVNIFFSVYIYIIYIYNRTTVQVNILCYLLTNSYRIIFRNIVYERLI